MKCHKTKHEKRGYESHFILTSFIYLHCACKEISDANLMNGINNMDSLVASQLVGNLVTQNCPSSVNVCVCVCV